MLARLASNFMQSLMPSAPSMAASSAAYPSTAPWGDYWYQTMGLPNAQGVVGGDEAYEYVSACFAATRFLCGMGSTINLNLTQKVRSSSGAITSQVLFEDPRQNLINGEANREQTSMSARSMLVAWQINRGTGMAEIERDAFTKEPLAYHPIYPTRCRPFYSQDDGTLWWHIKNMDGTDSDVPDSNMIRVPYTMMSRNGLNGVGVADRLFQTITLGQNLDRTENDASMSGVPRIVVEVPRVMNMMEQDAFRRQWRELYTQGGEQVAMLVGGATAKPLSWSATASDFTNRKDRHKQDCAIAYDVPPLLLNLILDPQADPAKLLMAFQKTSPKWLVMWIQELNRKLLTKEERLKGYEWKIDFASLLEADPVGRSQYYSGLFPLAALSPNEIREAEGKNPYPEGDKRFVQGAMRPIEEPYNANSPQNPKMDPKQGKADPLKGPKKQMRAQQAALKIGARAMMEDCLRRVTSKECRAAAKAAEKPKEWLNWVEEFYADHQVWVESELRLPLRTCGAFGVNVSASDMATRLADKSKMELIAVADGDPSKFTERVISLTTMWDRYRTLEVVQSIAELQ
jgi:HK97 family phage portal protein